jgi:hypothetical protein
VAKKIIIKLLLLVLILVPLNFIYYYTTYKHDLSEKSDKALEVIEKQEETDIFYFAESSNFSIQDKDSIKNSISEITNFFYPSLTITAVNKGATHAGIFKEWLKQIKPGKEKPKAVIITLNMRSFDAAWIHSKLETQLQESRVLLQSYPALVNRFLLSLNAFDDKTEQQREIEMIKEWQTAKLEFPFEFKYQTAKEWDNAMANGGYLDVDGNWDMPKIILACHYIKTYAFHIKDNNPRVKDFDEITDWCERNGIKLYLNLLAENVDYADSLVGKELVFLMKNNRDYLVKRYNKGNCIVIDNLEMVKGLEFTDQDWTTEHYNYSGRMRIAKNVAGHLSAQFKDNYKLAY